MKSKFTTFGFFILTLNRLLRLISVLCTGDGQWVKVRTCSEEGRKKKRGGWVFPFNFLLLCFACSVSFVSFSPSVFFVNPLSFHPFSWDESSFHPVLQRRALVSVSHKAWPSLTPRQPLAQFIKRRPTSIHHPHHLSYPRTSWKPLSLLWLQCSRDTPVRFIVA